MTKLPKRLGWGDICNQGLSFYGGNVQYEYVFVVEESGEYAIGVTKIRAPLIGIHVNEEKTDTIKYSPYLASLGYLEKGTHHISIAMFGNRMNTFGQLQLTDEQHAWYGESAWRTKDDCFSYNDQLKKVGILKEPQLYVKK